MCYVSEAIIYHAHHLTLLSYCRQHFAYGKGAFHYHRIRKKRKSGTMTGEMNFHTNLRNWLLAPFSWKKKRSFMLFLLLILWQFTNLTGFLWAAWFERELSR